MSYEPIISFDLVEDIDSPELERFKAKRNASKVTYDFRVKIEYKEDFINWLRILSSTELGISSDEKDVFIKDKDYDNTSYIRIKISGEAKARSRCLDNVTTVHDFFNSDMCGDIEYLKFDKRE